MCSLSWLLSFKPSIKQLFPLLNVTLTRSLLCVSASDYGLFLSDDDPRKGIWLESGRTLDYYMLRNGVKPNHRAQCRVPSNIQSKDCISFPSFLVSQDVLEYKKKQRPQKIKMLDGAVKTIMVDDSKTVGELLVTICSRIGG